ncbi:MAG: TM1812 family CRISPR-associated protein, partial [Candidatus Kryptonium sp.]
MLILQIFTDLVKRYLEEPFSTLYLDISSGHNIYISAVIEAGRLFSTFTNLQHLGSKEKAPKIFITFSEPIRPNYDGPYKVFTDYAFETKAFYHYPLLPTTSNLKDAYTIHAKDVSIEIADGNRAFKNKLNEILSHGYFFYSALKNNTPLVLYFWEHHPAESIETFLKEINNLVIKKLSTNYLNVHINNIDLIKKVYLCLSLYLGIVRILRERTIKPKAEVNLR